MRKSDGEKKTNDDLNREIHQHNHDGNRLLDAANQIQRMHQAHHENSSLTTSEMKQVGDKIREAAREFHKTIELQSELIEQQSQTINQELQNLCESESVESFATEEWLTAANAARWKANDQSASSGTYLGIKDRRQASRI